MKVRRGSKLEQERVKYSGSTKEGTLTTQRLNTVVKWLVSASESVNWRDDMRPLSPLSDRGERNSKTAGYRGARRGRGRGGRGRGRGGRAGPIGAYPREELFCFNK